RHLGLRHVRKEAEAMTERPVTPEEREKSISMFYEHVERKGGPAWDELDEEAKQHWRDVVDEHCSRSMAQLRALDELAKKARPLSEMQGRADGACLVGGLSYAMKDGKLYGP